MVLQNTQTQDQLQEHTTATIRRETLGKFKLHKGTTNRDMMRLGTCLGTTSPLLDVHNEKSALSLLVTRF